MTAKSSELHDPAESRNLGLDHPGKAVALRDELLHWFDSMKKMP